MYDKNLSVKNPERDILMLPKRGSIFTQSLLSELFFTRVRQKANKSSTLLTGNGDRRERIKTKQLEQMEWVITIAIFQHKSALIKKSFVTRHILIG